MVPTDQKEPIHIAEHRCGCEYFYWFDPEMTDQATIVINGLLRKLDRMESEKRIEALRATEVPREREREHGEETNQWGVGEHDRTTATEEPPVREHGEEDKPEGGRRARPHDRDRGTTRPRESTAKKTNQLGEGEGRARPRERKRESERESTAKKTIQGGTKVRTSGINLARWRADSGDSGRLHWRGFGEPPTQRSYGRRGTRMRTDGRQQRRTSRHGRGLVEEELADNELRGVVGVDGQQDVEDSTPARSSGSGKEGRPSPTPPTKIPKSHRYRRSHCPPPTKFPNPTEKTKSQRNRSPAKSVFTATFIAPNQLFIFIAPNQLLIFTATFIATYIPTISCLSDRLVSVSFVLSTLVSPSLAQPVALVTPSLFGHRPPNPQPPTNLSSRSLALNSLSLVFPSLAQPVTPVSLVSLSLSGHRPPNPQAQTICPRTPLLPGSAALLWSSSRCSAPVVAGEDGIPQFDREENNVCLPSLKIAYLNTMESRTEFEEQKRFAWDLQNHIEDSNSEVVGQRHQFSFDKVFNPEEPQEEVFAEISQLVQNAVDGHKVLDLSTLTWSRVEAKVDGLCGIIISRAFGRMCFGHSLISWGNKLLSIVGHTKDPSTKLDHRFRYVIYLKAFDPLAYTWSILKTYGKAPVFGPSDAFDFVQQYLKLYFSGFDVSEIANLGYGVIIAFVAALPLFALTLIVELTLFSF
ncbi:hypothetical protein Syun_013935 [Stephania yunnanensis]|uniref:Spindle pole body-associated protein Vik1/Cik1 microtubule binding domain-containing protein n=1 Tax=Stephania yunnanensis TaxID=152371 RepID=A0AAP0PBB1_9MAGN